MSKDHSYEIAYNFKLHMKKLKEIEKSPTKRIDNHLPQIFLNVKKRHGYKDLWSSHKINKENQQLLNKLIEIRTKQPTYGKAEQGINNNGKKFEKEALFEESSLLLVKNNTTSISNKEGLRKGKRNTGPEGKNNRRNRSNQRIDKIRLEPIQKFSVNKL